MKTVMYRSRWLLILLALPLAPGRAASSLDEMDRATLDAWSAPYQIGKSGSDLSKVLQ